MQRQLPASPFKKPTVLKEVLRALMPYTRTNFMLAYHPGQFFAYLEKVTGASRPTSRAKRQQLIEYRDELWQVNWRGRMRAGLLPSQKLEQHKLLVLFDIPERQRATRDQLRHYLKTQGFKQLQRSVWITDYDVRQEIIEVINEYQLQAYVKLALTPGTFPS